MSWVKWSDRANSHPVFMTLAEIAADEGDARLETEVKGALFALAQWSAQTESDYVVPWGAAVRELGIGRAKALVDLLIKIGALTDSSEADERKYKLIDDEQGLFHIIKRNEKMMKAKRTRDRNNGSLVVPVLLRDGRHCRYTGEPVNFKDRKTDEGGTFDHRAPDEDTTPENFVVSSRGSNRARADYADPDSALPLMDPPESPEYDEWIISKLKRWPGITARVAKEFGIPNPLTRATVEAAPTQPPAGATDPINNNPFTQIQAPSDSQTETEPLLPEDSRKVESQGRVAPESQPRRATSSATPALVHPRSPEPAVTQPACDPQGEPEAHARASRPAKETPDPVRKRRRRRRR